MKLPARETALVVIDVQVALFDPPPAEAEEVIARINGLAARARAAGVPVVLVQHETAAGALVAETPGWALHPALETAPSDLRVRKRTPDSFLRTELHALLAGRHVRELVVCGFACEFCVDTTTRSAAAKGYPVTLAADAHTTHDKPHATGLQIRTHENQTLPDITSFGVTIRAVPAAEIGFG
ncbi:MAG TPA: cysteine hydrolase family protein [Burkholderiaceae bacterium]